MQYLLVDIQRKQYGRTGTFLRLPLRTKVKRKTRIKSINPADPPPLHPQTYGSQPLRIVLWRSLCKINQTFNALAPHDATIQNNSRTLPLIFQHHRVGHAGNIPRPACPHGHPLEISSLHAQLTIPVDFGVGEGDIHPHPGGNVRVSCHQ